MNPTRTAKHAAALLLLACLAAGPSLKDLSDEPLRTELATDGLGALLERSFVIDDLPEDQRAAPRAIAALHELPDPRLSPTQRAARLHQIVLGIGAVLPQITDPQLLLSAAQTLVKQGVEPDLNVLEYFGEDSSDPTKARLQPVVNTAVAMYDRAVQLLDDRQNALQNKITRPGDPIAAVWQQAYQQFQTATYTRWMLVYAQALAADRADVNRPKLIDQAIQQLGQWDSPDSGVMPVVQLQIGKLWMIKGSPEDLNRAGQYFAKVQADLAPSNPDRYTIFNAMYFSAVAKLLARDSDGADRQAQAADEFRMSHLAGVTGDEYAMDMLHYRIALAKGDDPSAVRILQDLSDKAPGLRAVIAGHLLDRLPAHPDPATLPPLMLSALIERAWMELSRPAPDPATLQAALAAANQYLSRADKADPDTTPEGTINASRIRGVILQSLGHPDQAAAAYLDHADRFKTDPDAQADQAINQAIIEIAQLYKNSQTATPSDNDNSHQSDVAALEDRLLPLAVGSFRRYDLAYEYARRLQRAGQSAKAADVFDLVPAEDPNAFNALFFKMVALNQRLDAPATDAVNSVFASDLPAVAKELQSLADRVIETATARAAAAASPDQARPFVAMRTRATLLAADVALHRLHDPQRTLALLTDFRKNAAPLTDSKDLISDALNLRVAAYLEAGRTSDATSTLLQYLTTAGGDQGLQTVYNLLTRLNQEMDRAQGAHDAPRVRELANDRAALTPFLVKWAAANPDPDINKFTYRYRVFDAATLEQAADLEPEPAKRTTMLNEAMSRYQQLQSPDNVQLYVNSLPPDADPAIRNSADPAVSLGIANVAFALGNWQLAHNTIGQLLADSRLGDATMVVKNPAGQDETVDNDQFWQAQYDFLYATVQLSRDPASGVSPQTPHTILARLSAIWQDKLGGAKWHDKFVDLANELNAAPAASQP